MSKPLTLQEAVEITNQFYSRFTCMDVSEIHEGIYFTGSEERDQEVKGFGCKYPIFALVKEDACIVAYAPKYEEFISALKQQSKEVLIERLSQHFNLKPMQLMILKEEKVQDFRNARILTKEDYPLYEEFFMKMHPNANPEGWLEEYFQEKTEKEYHAGYVVEGKLVSVCDAPDMPYMEDQIQHTGIQTLETERRKGYARCTAALAAHHMLENGVCPQWECRVENTASIALAESIGYEKYGMAYILEK